MKPSFSRPSIVSLVICLGLNSACTQVTGSSINSKHLPDPLEAGWKGQPVCEQLSLTETQRVLKCTFAPGVGHDRHFHAAHFGYALSGGRMQLHDDSGTREVDLATGSHFTSEGTEWHEVLNTGTTTVQYLIIEALE